MTKLFILFVAAMLLGTSSARADGLVINFHLTQIESDNGATPVTTQKDYVATLFPRMIDLRSGDSEEIFDFGSEQYFQADLSKHTILSYPLCAIPVSNRLERDRHLEALSQAAQRANPATRNPNVKDVDVDMLYGSQGDMNTADMISTSVSDKTTTFTAGGRELASVSSSNVAVPAGLRQSYAHLFLYTVALHPVIDKAVGDAPDIFSTLKFINRDGSNNSSFALTVVSARSTTAGGPDINGMTQIYTGNDRVDAVIRQSAGPMKSQQELEQKISGFLEKNDHLRAALAAKEMELMIGPAAQSSVIGKAALGTSDAQTRALLDAIDTPARSTDQFVQHMQEFNQAKSAVPDYDYLIELLRAEQIRAVLQNRTKLGADEQQAMHAAFDKISGAISANGWLTAAYCDLGDAYFRDRQPRQAWILWQQARRINPDYPGLQTANLLQQHALKDFPEYF